MTRKILLLLLNIMVLSCGDKSFKSMKSDENYHILESEDEEESKTEVEEKYQPINIPKIIITKSQFPNFVATTLDFSKYDVKVSNIYNLDMLNQVRDYSMSRVYNSLKACFGVEEVDENLVLLMMLFSEHISPYDSVLVLGIGDYESSDFLCFNRIYYDDYIGYFMLVDQLERVVSMKGTKGHYQQIKNYKKETKRHYRMNGFKELQLSVPEEVKIDSFQMSPYLIEFSHRVDIHMIPIINCLFPSNDFKFIEGVFSHIYLNDLQKFVFFKYLFIQNAGEMLFYIIYDLRNDHLSYHPLLYQKESEFEKILQDHEQEDIEKWEGAKYFIESKEFFPNRGTSSITTFVREDIDMDIEINRVYTLNLISSYQRLLIKNDFGKFIIVHSMKPLRDDSTNTILSIEKIVNTLEPPRPLNPVLAPANTRELNCRCNCTCFSCTTALKPCRCRWHFFNSCCCNIL